MALCFVDCFGLDGSAGLEASLIRPHSHVPAARRFGIYCPCGITAPRPDIRACVPHNQQFVSSVRSR